MGQEGARRPSKNLVDTTIAEELSPLGPTYPIKAIHSGSRSLVGTVCEDIINHFRTTSRGRGEILFVTYTAFLSLPNLHRRSDWEVVMGEKPKWLKAECF